MFKPLSPLSADKVVRDLELRCAEYETRLNAANIIIADQNRALARAFAAMRRVRSDAAALGWLRRRAWLAHIRGANK